MPLDLSRREAHVWFVIPESVQDASTIDHCQAVLSEQEMARYKRFHFKDDRHRYLISHALVRYALSMYADISPDEWQFSCSERGKPAIGNRQARALRFNLTHTRGLSACVVTHSNECGIDAEQLVMRHNPIGVAKRMFSENEYLEVQRLEGDRQLQYFLERWTLREAYVKARGTGISFPTRKLYFELDENNHARIRLDTGNDGHNDNWQIQLLKLSNKHVAAIAIATEGAPNKTIICREFQF